MDIIDMFSLFPMTKNIVKNQSKDIFNIMSGNKFNGASIVPQDVGGSNMSQLLDLLWIKLDERFLTIADAFRYFDKNYNNKVSFGEFQKALDNLRIKFQVD
jgi:Ca2+-binding EF-hand superfamily protein